MAAVNNQSAQRAGEEPFEQFSAQWRHHPIAEQYHRDAERSSLRSKMTI